MRSYWNSHNKRNGNPANQVITERLKAYYMTLVHVLLKDLLTTRKIKSFSSQSEQSSQALEGSLDEVGFLNPLIVTKQKSKYLVLDGKKRLQALLQLTKSRGRSRLMSRVPCVMEWPAPHLTGRKSRPALMRAPELAHAIVSEIKGGQSTSSIATKYDCSKDDVIEALSFQGLHPTVSMHFNNEAINWEQAAALATIQNPYAQLNLLLQLGPFVSDSEIIAAIREGATVIDLPDGNTICLPSRKLTPIQKFDSASHNSAFLKELAA